jgi:hypothetical protein
LCLAFKKVRKGKWARIPSGNAKNCLPPLWLNRFTWNERQLMRTNCRVRCGCGTDNRRLLCESLTLCYYLRNAFLLSFYFLSRTLWMDGCRGELRLCRTVGLTQSADLAIHPPRLNSRRKDGSLFDAGLMRLNAAVQAERRFPTMLGLSLLRLFLAYSKQVLM